MDIDDVISKPERRDTGSPMVEPVPNNPELQRIFESNKKLEENPEYPVPEGFAKVVEKDLVYRYEVPEFLPMPENQRFCVEFLDDTHIHCPFSYYTKLTQLTVD